MSEKPYTRICITLPTPNLKRFKKFCDDNAIKMSTKISKLIEKEMTRGDKNR